MPYLTKRMARCLKKVSLLGAGLGGTAIVTSYVMTKKKTNSEEYTEYQNDNIYDLEEIVKQKAWAKYKRDHTPRGWFAKITNTPMLQLDWDDVESIPEKPVFTESAMTPKKKDVIYVLYQTVFENKSTKYQQHKLRADVKTLSMCKSSLTEGFTKSSGVGLFLQAPDEVANEAVTFSKGFSISHVNGNVHEMVISRTSEDIIRVPCDSKITVSKAIKEVQRAFDFQTIVEFVGHVKGCFYDGDRQRVALYEIPISAIIKDLPMKMITEKDGRYYIKINGRCFFKYQIEQDTNICDNSL